MRKFISRAAALLLSGVMPAAVAGCGKNSDSEAKDTAKKLRELDQTQITEAMGLGWNLGNQLEASSGGLPSETCWGNPEITKELIDTVKAQGFKHAPLKSNMGKEIIFGIRPEDVHDPEFAPVGIDKEMVDAKIEVTELMGNEVILYLNAQDKNFLARVDPRSKGRVGNSVSMAFNMDNIHIFDAKTEKAIR